MRPGTVRAISSMLEYLERGGEQAMFTASIFTTTGHKGACSMAIRKLKAAGAIAPAGKDSKGRTTYRRGSSYKSDLSSLDFEMNRQV